MVTEKNIQARREEHSRAHAMLWMIGRRKEGLPLS